MKSIKSYIALISVLFICISFTYVQKDINASNNSQSDLNFKIDSIVTIFANFL